MDDKAQEELKKVEDEINVVLAKYQCALQPVVVLTDGQVTARLNVVKLKEPIENPNKKSG
jgi:hypothetical protein